MTVSVPVSGAMSGMAALFARWQIARNVHSHIAAGYWYLGAVQTEEAP
jgi:hypothetical protein